MSKHTGAPWKRDGRTVYALVESTERGKPRQVNRFTAQVNGGGPDGAPEEELIANTELMRCAPEMETAIRAVIADWEDGRDFHPAMLRRHIQALRLTLPGELPE